LLCHPVWKAKPKGQRPSFPTEGTAALGTVQKVTVRVQRALANCLPPSTRNDLAKVKDREKRAKCKENKCPSWRWWLTSVIHLLTRQRPSAQANSSQDPISKITRAKWTGGVVQTIECQLCKLEALTSNPCPTKNKNKNNPHPTILHLLSGFHSCHCQ
jgi:hypothetical protein